MDLSGRYFNYDGKSSVNIPSNVPGAAGISLRFVEIETEKFRKTSGTTELYTAFNRKTRTRSLMGTKYDTSPLSFEVEIASETPIAEKDFRDIARWLFGRSRFEKLYPLLANGGREGENYLRCVFCNPEKIEFSGGLFGWRCTVECDSYLAHCEPTVVSPTIQTTGGASYVDVTVDTDFAGYTYPKITVSTAAPFEYTPPSGGSFEPGILASDGTVDTSVSYSSYRTSHFVEVSAGSYRLSDGGSGAYLAVCQYTDENTSTAIDDTYLKEDDGEIEFTVENDCFLRVSWAPIAEVSVALRRFVPPLILTNTTDGSGAANTMEMEGLSTGLELVIDGRANTISSAGVNYLDCLTNRRFLGLLNGTNRILLPPAVDSISFEFENMRYLT